MAWTTPVNLATGDKVTDTIWNLQVIDNLNYLYNLIKSYALLEDQKASGTNGGTFTSGAFRTRDLTVKVTDVTNLCSLAANQVTLISGTYVARWAAETFSVGNHMSRLQNITSGVTLGYALSGRAQGTVDVNPTSFGAAYFTLAATSVLELQHQCSSTQANTGFGTASSISIEIFSRLELWKMG